MIVGRALVVLTIAGLAAVGCGGGEQSNQDQIEAVVKQWTSDIAGSDGSAACDALTGPYQRGILSDQISGDCPSRLEQYSAQLGDEEKSAFAQTEITAVQMDGEDKALACTKSPQPNPSFDNTGAYNMEKFDGVWKIASNNEIETC